jgi:hypothetical protein
MAVQVFQNLGVLPTKLEALIQSLVDKVSDHVKNALDVHKITAAAETTGKAGMGGAGPSAGPGRANFPSSGNMVALRATLWSNLESALDVIVVHAAEAACLQLVLCRRRDSVSHLTFLELLHSAGEGKGHGGAVLAAFWSGAVAALAKGLSTATQDSGFLKQALEGEYPKLLRLFNEMWQRLRASAADLRPETFQGLSKRTTGAVWNPLLEANMDGGLRATIEGMERAYLSRSLSRLFDPVNLMFSSGDVPTDAELHQVFKGVASEINVASSVDTQLAITVGRNVAKTVRLMAVKCEQMLVTDGEASQVVGYPTDGQRRNVAIVNCLWRFRVGVQRIVNDSQLPVEGAETIVEALADIDRLTTAGINPLLNSVSDAIEAIIATLHNEDFAAEAKGSTADAASCSPYMRELQTFLSRMAADFLRDFEPQALVAAAAAPLAARAIQQFVVQASLVRPVNAVGRKRLADDCSELERALEPLYSVGGSMAGDACPELPVAFATLRAFRGLVTATPEGLIESPLVGQDLPTSLALHLLFGWAPRELRSPHDTANWSLSRYTRWLEDHPNEEERLRLIQGALEGYVASTRAKGEKSYAFPYPLMLQMLERAQREPLSSR